MAGQRSGLIRWIEARPLAVFALCFAAGTAIAHAAPSTLWLVWAIAAAVVAALTIAFRQRALAFSLAMCGGIAVCAFCFSGAFVGIFLEKPVNGQALETGVRFLHLVSPFYLLLACKMCADGLLKGLGNMRVFTVSTVLDLCVRVGSAFLLSPTLGYTAICLGYPLGWVVGLTVTELGLRRERQTLAAH